MATLSIVTSLILKRHNYCVAIANVYHQNWRAAGVQIYARSMVNKKNKHDHVQRSHFTLGNDERSSLSSYWHDFGLVYNLSGERRRAHRPPSPAEIIPLTVNHGSSKWLSSNKQDFDCYKEISRNIYRRSVQEFNDTKVFQTCGNGLSHFEKLPSISRSALDYRQPKLPSIDNTRELLKTVKTQNGAHCMYNSNPTLISEAMQAFQWPSRQRLKPVALYRYPNLAWRR